MWWLCDNLYSLTESSAPGEALGRLRGWDTSGLVAGAVAEALADAEATPPAQEQGAKAPRGGWF
jgi:hypothetical protein